MVSAMFDKARYDVVVDSIDCSGTTFKGLGEQNDGHTGMRSEYFCRMRSASALRFSNWCSSLNLERMVADEGCLLSLC